MNLFNHESLVAFMVLSVVINVLIFNCINIICGF